MALKKGIMKEKRKQEEILILQNQNLREHHLTNDGQPQKTTSSVYLIKLQS